MMIPTEAALAELVPIAIENYGVGDEDMGWMVSDYRVLSNVISIYLRF